MNTMYPNSPTFNISEFKQILAKEPNIKKAFDGAYKGDINKLKSVKLTIEDPHPIEIEGQPMDNYRIRFGLNFKENAMSFTTLDEMKETFRSIYGDAWVDG
jgi:hypothetical protein